MLKNKIIIGILAMTLSLPVFAESSGFFTDLEPVDVPESIESVSTSEPKETKLPELPKKEIKNYLPHKQPVSKKQLAKKFIIAMLCVGLSSFILYFGLAVYNRIREGFISTLPKKPDSDSILNDSNSINDAVRIFLEKTKWN